VRSTSILRPKETVRTVYIFQRQIHVDSTSKFPYPSGLLIHQRRIYVDSTSRFSHGSKRDIIGDLEVPVVTLFAPLSAIKQWCKLKNKRE